MDEREYRYSKLQIPLMPLTNLHHRQNASFRGNIVM